MQWLIHNQLQNVPAFGLQIWNAMFSLLFVKCNYLCCYPTASLQIRRWDVGRDTDSRQTAYISPSAPLLPSRPCWSARTRADWAMQIIGGGRGRQETRLYLTNIILICSPEEIYHTHTSHMTNIARNSQVKTLNIFQSESTYMIIFYSYLNWGDLVANSDSSNSCSSTLTQ